MPRGTSGQPSHARLDSFSEATLKDITEGFRASLLEEADRLAAQRDDGSGQEPITPGDLRRAADRLRESAEHRPSRLQITCLAGSYLAAIVAGFFVSDRVSMKDLNLAMLSLGKLIDILTLVRDST